jgi:hypothetical protein
MSLFLSFSQIWLNLPMDDGQFGYITQKQLIHSFPLETFLPSDCTNFLLEKRKRNQAITNLFSNSFPSIRAIKLKSERVACKNKTTYWLLTLRVRCIYNLHTCTLIEQSTDSPPNHKAPNAMYITLLCKAMVVMLPKQKNQFTFELWFWAMLDFINNHHQF